MFIYFEENERERETERERQRETEREDKSSGGAEREREGEKEYQASSMLSVQSLMCSSNSQTMEHDLSGNQESDA